MGAFVLTKVPDPYVSSSVAADEFALVGVNDDVVDRHAMSIVPLNRSRPCIPDLDRPILGACYHPFSLAVESHSGDIVRVAVKCEDSIGVAGFYIVEFDRVVSRGGQVSFVGRNAEAVDLGVTMGNGARTYS